MSNTNKEAARTTEPTEMEVTEVKSSKRKPKIKTYSPEGVTVSKALEMHKEIMEGKGDPITGDEVMRELRDKFNSKNQSRPKDLRKAHGEISKLAKKAMLGG